MSNNRVNEIDLLRFCAALAVVFFHYSFRGYAADNMTIMPYPLLMPIAKYGYLGVELFFMISGFVILMTAANGSLRSFIISRITRLYPAFWACCTITCAVTLAIGYPRYSVTMSQYLINMTMFNNFVDVPYIDGSYWSLCVELKFYALIILLLIIRRIHQAQTFLLLWLISTIALEFFPIYKLSKILITDYATYFIAGATYYLIWSQGISWTRLGIIILSLEMAIFQSLNRLTRFEQHYHTEMNRSVVLTVVISFFVIMLLISVRQTGFFGRNRWLKAGALTYPLYLIHHNIGFMLFNIAYPAINPHVILWGAVLLSLGLAYAVHIFIEKRFSLPLKNNINNALDRIQYVTTRSLRYRIWQPRTRS